MSMRTTLISVPGNWITFTVGLAGASLGVLLQRSVSIFFFEYIDRSTELLSARGSEVVESGILS